MDMEEMVLIGIILTLWGLTLALFFQRWGKYSTPPRKIGEITS
jgi:hypothetical protein